MFSVIFVTNDSIQAPAWWLGGVVIPAFFTLLGAIVGFLIGEVKEWLQARRGKKAFLRAIAAELSVIKSVFEEVANSAVIFLQKLQESGHAPQLIALWRTTVFDTQLGKLRDVTDHLVLETIQTYAVVNRIGRIVEFLNENSRAYVSARDGNEKAGAQSRLGSGLRVLQEETVKALAEIQALLQKLASLPS